MPREGARRRGLRGGKVDLDLRGPHAPEEVPVVRRDDPFAVRQDPAGPPAAEAAGRMRDHGAGLAQHGKRPVLQRLEVSCSVVHLTPSLVV